MSAARNVIADITLGGTINVLGNPVSTPVLKIVGLQSVADSWNDSTANGGKGKFGHAESFGFGGISLELPEGTPIPPEVQSLLDIITQAIPVNQIVNQLIDLLESVGTLEIPGLGTISLGHTTGKATDALRRGQRLRAEDPGQQPGGRLQDRPPARPCDQHDHRRRRVGRVPLHDVGPGPAGR